MILSTSHSLLFWSLLAVCLVAYILPSVRTTAPPSVVRVCLTVAWVIHGILLGAALLTGKFGFGPALSVMAWLVLAVYAIESKLFPQLRTRRALAALGAAALVIGVVFPGAPMSHGSDALPLHAALGLAAYGMIAAATLHAWLMRRTEEQMRATLTPDTGLPLMTLERLMMLFVYAGLILLTATLLAGWWFAGDLYGPGYAWARSHKTVFSVLAWIVLASLVAGTHFLGWRGSRAARWVYGAAALLLLAYVGTRFVLEVLLQRAAAGA